MFLIQLIAAKFKVLIGVTNEKCPFNLNKFINSIKIKRIN